VAVIAPPELSSSISAAADRVFRAVSGHSKIPLEAALFVITGFVGARTTFSTFGGLWLASPLAIS